MKGLICWLATTPNEDSGTTQLIRFADMRLSFSIVSLFLWVNTAYSQKCEQFPRHLFHMLSIDVPDNINCIDSNGRKQGWWIYYKVEYNPQPIPDVLAKGDYVDHYDYGRYKDDKKVGAWKRVNNVHLVYEASVDSTYNSNDTTIRFLRSGKTTTVIRTKDSTIEIEYDGMFMENSFTVFKYDSSVINSQITIQRKGSTSYDTVEIRCNQKADYCKIYLQKKVIKTHPFRNYEIIKDNIASIIENELEEKRFRR